MSRAGAVGAVVLAGFGFALGGHLDAMAIVLGGSAVVWACCAALVAGRAAGMRLALAMVMAAAALALALLVRGAAPRAVPLAALLLGASALHVLLWLAPGDPARAARLSMIVGYAGAAAVGGALAALDVGGAAAAVVVTACWVVACGWGLLRANRTYRATGPAGRRAMSWVGWALSVALELALVVLALRLLARWPPEPGAVSLAATAVVPVSLVGATHPRLAGRADRLVTGTVALAGLTALVIAAYGAVILSLGRRLEDGERPLLLLSMAAATGAALAFPPLRARLVDATNQLVYGQREAPDEALRTWGSRLTRAIPMDELLLQLAESLRKSMNLASAEVYAGGDGTYELVAGVPHRRVEPLHVPAKSQGVVARAGVSGGTWLEVWLPGLAAPAGRTTRVAPIVHAGQLLGLIVACRVDELAFSEEEDRVLTELARQVGLALHNVQLDSALQASLVELQVANNELQESRRRIVTAADAERRKLERNLHDGAQQHLVAMAVKLRLAEDLIEESPAEAVEALSELRSDLKDAIAELRALAHGIFPPLLSSGGLAEALPNAANRAALQTTVDTTGVGRYGPEIESSVYFCCLEAMQNAGKHAGPDAEVTVVVRADDALLSFEVSDDGAGFEPGPAGAAGHGFVNMADRLGTVGGRLSIRSAPGVGTTIRGEIPLPG